MLTGYYKVFIVLGNGFESPYYHVSVARSKSPTGPYERRDWAYFLHTDTVRNKQWVCIFKAHN